MNLHTLGALSVIVFLWAFHQPFVHLGTDVVRSIGANVGISVGVDETIFNKLAQEIGDKQTELDVREKMLAEAEDRLNRQSTTVFSIEWYVTLLAFILLVLVLLNFYLDFRHREQPRV